MKTSSWIFVLSILLSLFSCDTFGQIGYLKIKVNVESVVISLDGKTEVINPNQPVIKEISIGLHTITASKQGYQSQTKTISISENEVNEVEFYLALPEKWEVDKNKSSGILGVEYGGITIVVKSNGKLVSAKVYVDDSPADNAPVSISKLFVGTHKIKVEYNSIQNKEP